MAVKQKHRYTTCHDDDCPRASCQAYKLGYEVGFEEGYAAGVRAGEGDSK